MNIEARELSKIYGSGESRVVALDKADLKIGQGDFLSITGPSGSGKSTLLHLLSGLDRPTSGCFPMAAGIFTVSMIRSFPLSGAGVSDLSSSSLTFFRF